MFQTNYTAGGRLDSPHYPTFQVPFVKGLTGIAASGVTTTLEFTVPFYGELFSVSIDCSSYQNDDSWNLKMNGEMICDQIYVKRAPEGINLMAFIPVAPGAKVTIEFFNVGAEKAIWCSLQFLKKGDLSLPMPTEPQGDLEGIKLSERVVRLYVFDHQIRDGEILDIYVNDALVKKDMILENDVAGDGVFGVNYIEIPLQPGDNAIRFAGVSPGDWDNNNNGNNLLAKFRIKNLAGVTLFESTDLPDLFMAEDVPNLDANRRYIVQPSITWIMTSTE